MTFTFTFALLYTTYLHILCGLPEFYIFILRGCSSSGVTKQTKQYKRRRTFAVPNVPNITVFALRKECSAGLAQDLGLTVTVRVPNMDLHTYATWIPHDGEFRRCELHWRCFSGYVRVERTWYRRQIAGIAVLTERWLPWVKFGSPGSAAACLNLASTGYASIGQPSVPRPTSSTLHTLAAGTWRCPMINSPLCKCKCGVKVVIKVHTKIRIGATKLCEDPWVFIGNAHVNMQYLSIILFYNAAGDYYD